MQSEKDSGKKRKEEEKIIVVMASRRRAMKALGRVTVPPDTTFGGCSPRDSLRDLTNREREIYLNVIRRQKKGQKINIKHAYTINEHP